METEIRQTSADAVTGIHRARLKRAFRSGCGGVQREVSCLAKALLLVDLSKDFVYLDGALNCGQAGIDIIPYCRELVRSFVAAGDWVFDARDAHDLEDDEIASGLFPPHNLRNTPGQLLIPELYTELGDKQSNYIYFPKKHYNAGLGTGLFDVIVQKDITEIHVIGVCTDICVRYTINALYDFKTTVHRELNIVVHQSGVASFNQNGHEDSLRHFPLAFGAKVV